MRKPLKPNHLANILDHQSHAAKILPKNIMETCFKLQELTDEIKNLLDNCLPDEILRTLVVGKYDDGHLTMSVQSHTAANHLRYQSNNLITILKEQSLTFNQLNNIDVIVTHSNFPNNSKIDINTYPEQISQNYTVENGKNLVIKGLTNTTRRTITHTATHVINDVRLKKALKKLANT